MPGPVRTEVTPIPPVGQGNQADPNSTASVSNPNSPYYNPEHSSYQATSDSSTTTYVDLGVTSETGEEVYDGASTTVTNADATHDDGWFGDLIEDFTRGSRVRDQYEQDMAAQAQELAQGITTRPGPGMPQTNYLSYDHGTSLKPMVTQDVDPADVGATGEMWTNTGNAMTTFQRSVAEAINRSTTEWQGAAGNSARSFMADVANWIGGAGQSAQLAGTQTSLQASALSQAKNTMPEPVPYDRQSYVNRMNGATSIDEVLTIADEAQAQYDAHQEAHTEAARVVGTYDGSLRAASTMPAFGAPPTMDGNGGDPTSLPTSTTQVGGTGRNTPPPGIDTLWTPPKGPGDDNNNGDDDNNDDDNNDDDNDDNGNNEDDPGQTTPGETGGYPGYPGNPGNPGGQTGTGTGGGPGYPGMPMGGPMGPGFGAGDTERGMGRSGYGARGGFGSGAGFGGSGGANSGAGGLGPRGLGAGAMAAEHAAFGGRGGLGAGGRGSTGGGMPMGARGDDEEDGEHQRPSFLVEPDPDEVFGTDQLTAPPVIGE